MGKKDTLTKQYLAQNAIFADAFNYFLFDGEKVIMPDDLQEQDTTELAVVEQMREVFASQKMRDVLKLCNIKHCKVGTLVLMGIEGQANIHYSMPVRDYLYDALNYASQVETIRKHHKEVKDLRGSEKISGFSKDDHIIPVITLCICFDKHKWDAPRSLYDMFGDLDERIKRYVDDYKLNLITPDEIDDFSKFSSEIGFVLEVIRNTDDKNKLYDIIKSKGDTPVDIRTLEMINEYTGLEVPVEKAEGGKAMVCKAVKELQEDWLNEGREEGIDMLTRLLKAITPDSKDFDKALNATKTEREELFRKYNII